MKKLFIIDGFSSIFQAFYAIRGLTSPDGLPSNAIFGFASLLARLRDVEHADYLCVAFDTSKPTFRHERFPDYKAHRKEMPEELVPQVPVIKEIVSLMGIPQYECPGFEADDIIATIAKRLADQDIEVNVISSDKDLRQIFTVNPRAVFYLPRDGSRQTPEIFTEAFGVRPDQVADYLGLAGDASDNIPGVEGIGPKRAAELLQTYGTLDNLYAHAAELKASKMKDNLIAQEATARLSRELALLHYDTPVPFRLEDCVMHRPREQELITRLTQLGLNRLVRQLIGRNGGETAAPAATATAVLERPANGGGDDDPPANPGKAERGDYFAITTERELKDLCRQLERAAVLAVDTETTGTEPTRAALVGISVSAKAGAGYYIPIRSPEGGLPLETVRHALQPHLGKASLPKIGQNIKYDLIMLRRHGFALEGLAFDTMIADYLLDPSLGGHDMDTMALRHLNYKTIPIGDLIGGTKNKPERTMDQVPLDRITQYAGEDADITLRLCQCLQPPLKASGMQSLFDDVEIPLIPVLADMEMAGIRVDADYLKELSREYHARQEKLAYAIHKEAGREFTINSPKQLGEVLFKEMGIPPQKKGKTGFSTDSEVLESLAPQYPIARLVLDWRELAKLTSTYIDTLPELISPEDGRVHTSFNQTVAATGRLSSTNPNLQNIPVKTENGREIRRAFVAADAHHQLVSADYSQIELRFMAHFSGDARLIEAFGNDEDIHRAVAASIFGVNLKDVNDDQRRVAKTVNFGLIYGQSAHGLSQQLGISRTDAANFIRVYFERFQGVERFIEQAKEQARKTGAVTTILGRRRPLPAIHADNRMIRENAERMAVNTVVQGSAADLIKLAMLGVHRRLREDRLKSRLLLQIHDELVFDAPKSEVKPLEALVREILCGAMTLSVPLKVDVGAGANWLDAK